MLREPPGHPKSAQGNERDDEDWKPDCSNGLRDSDCARNTEDLETDEEAYFLARDSVEGVVRVEETFFGNQVPCLG